MPAMTEAQEVRTARLQQAAAFHLASLDAEGRRNHTASARAAYQQQLEAIIDPDGTLPAEELAYQLKQLRRVIMAEISILGVEARRRKREARQRAEADAQIEELLNLRVA